MYSKLKYLYLLSCLACGGYFISSCSSELPDKTEGEKGSEVVFTIPDDTRASSITSIDRFAVYGDMKMSGTNPASPTLIFNKTEVVKTDGVWGYDGTQYWFPNHEHSFVAIHPLSLLESAQYSDSKLSFTYTLPNSNNDAADILAVTHRRLYREGDAVSPVSFRFAHLLSLINFSIELTEPSTRSEECVKIHKFEMSGFGNSATFNIKPAPLQDNPQTDDSEIDIVTAKGNGSLTVSFDQPIEVINGAAAVKIFDSNNAIIMLPQVLEDNDKVQISLTYTLNDEAEETQVSANLSNFKWEWGRSYNYKIKLELEQKDVNMAIREATIVPWNLVDDHDEVDAR